MTLYMPPETAGSSSFVVTLETGIAYSFMNRLSVYFETAFSSSFIITLIAGIPYTIMDRFNMLL